MYKLKGEKLMINTNLKVASSYDPTKQSQSQTIEALNTDIKNNKITLPIYQRDLSWTLDKAVALFNYQLFGKAPVSPLSFNRISVADNTVTQVALISRNIIHESEVKEASLSVIDGQQRLSTNYRASIDDPEFANIVLDLNKGKFRLLKTGPKKFQIPVGKLLNEDNSVLSSYAVEKMDVKDFDDMTTLIDIRKKLTGYSYTLHIANGMNEAEQIEWFEVLNNAGSKVSALQMQFAKLGSTSYDIYSSYSLPFKDKIENFDLNNLFSPYTTNVSYPVALLNPELEKKLNQSHTLNYAPMPSDTKENKLAQLSTDDLKEIADKSLEDLDLALNFFEEHSLVQNITRMDYILDVAGYFAFKGPSLSQAQEMMIIDWVKNTNFTNKSNSARRKIFSDLIN
ncbi:DUF262 domain-containing protein [Pediococcus acidilactici]|uniref:GmrSD restriction endonuclease domain-containing protein n=1 Tax=Pediococcus acidilactici TaxID=1254 RepID=UPI001F335177|nr:DUF262 domain-containing protein [Pediococcus acidilactici]WQS10223.1 DUF262 domain-containing protein [Pediococcus acidilactici]